MTRRHRVRVTGLLVCALASPGMARAGQTYTITDLGSLGGDTSADGLNNSDQIVGWSEVSPDVRHAFRWENGVMVDLGTFGEFGSDARDINNSGAWGGWTVVFQFPFQYTHAIVVDSLGVLHDVHHDVVWQGQQPEFTSVFAVNDSNAAAGIFVEFDFCCFSGAFIWKNGTSINLTGLRPLDMTTAYELNNANDVVGFSSSASETVAVAWPGDGSGPIDLGTLTTQFARTDQAFAVNDARQIVGFAMTDESDEFGPQEHAFFWQSGVMTDLGTLGERESIGVAINENARAVGAAREDTAYWNEFIETFAAVWDTESGASFLLNDRAAHDPGWNLTAALDINESGNIVGQGFHDALPDLRAWLAVPDLDTTVQSARGPRDLIFTAINAVPGSTVRLLGSLTPGETPIPACPGAAVDLAGPRALAMTIADENGVATFNITIPALPPGTILYFQAASVGSCRVGNRIERTVV